MKLEPRGVSEGSLLLEFPESSDVEANRAAIAIASRLSAKRPRGLLDAIPGARTLFVLFDSRVQDREALIRRVRRAAEDSPEAPPESRLFRIPAAYGDENGPDLAALARDHGLAPEEVVRRHAAVEYRVAFLGFSPGFAYLAGLPPAVVARAKEILAGLEHDELTRGGRPTLSETPHDARSEQLGLFTTPAGRDDEISRMLRSVSVDDTTPLQALALLAELKRIIGE